MNTQRLLIALTVVNLALLTFSLAQQGAAASQDSVPVLRGRALEIVDEHGKVRASITVFPADPTYATLSARGTSASLKLTDQNGRQQLIKP